MVFALKLLKFVKKSLSHSTMNTSIAKYRIELENSCNSPNHELPVIIREVSNIFKTLESLILEKDLTNNQRLNLFAAIGYFFIPDDFFPEEELGEIGYIDDIILALTILKEIHKTQLGTSIIYRHWQLKISVADVFDNVLPSIIKDYPKQYITVLDYFGLLPEEFDMDFE